MLMPSSPARPRPCAPSWCATFDLVDGSRSIAARRPTSGDAAPRWDLIRGRAYGKAVTIATRAAFIDAGYCSIRSCTDAASAAGTVNEVATKCLHARKGGRVLGRLPDGASSVCARSLRAIAPFSQMVDDATTIRFAVR